MTNYDVIQKQSFMLGIDSDEYAIVSFDLLSSPMPTIASISVLMTTNE